MVKTAKIINDKIITNFNLNNIRILFQTVISGRHLLYTNVLAFNDMNELIVFYNILKVWVA